MTARDVEAVKERAVLMDGYVTVDFVDFTTLIAEIEELRSMVEAVQSPETADAIVLAIASKCQMCVLAGVDLGNHAGDAVAAYNAVIARIAEVTG